MAARTYTSHLVLEPSSSLQFELEQNFLFEEILDSEFSDKLRVQVVPYNLGSSVL